LSLLWKQQQKNRESGRYLTLSVRSIWKSQTRELGALKPARGDPIEAPQTSLIVGGGASAAKHKKGSPQKISKLINSVLK
jgi:hypothetical protein